MTYRNRKSRSGRLALLLGAFSGLGATGCTDAVFDAAAAGALDFIQTGVMTTLSSTIFGDAAMADTSTVMDDMTVTSDGEHDGHG